MSNILLGNEIQEKHDFLYWEFNERHGPLQAVRKDNWKLVKRYQKPIELYDLSKDISESSNLAEKYPDIVKNLSMKMSGSRTYHPEFTLKKLPNPYKKRNQN